MDAANPADASRAAGAAEPEAPAGAAQAVHTPNAPAEPIDPADIVFVTPRLVGRYLGAHDLDALVAVYGDAEAMRWVGDGRPLTRDSCARWVEVTRENYERRGYGMFALVARKVAKPALPAVPPRAGGPPFAPQLGPQVGPHLGPAIGFCGLVHPGGQVEAEVKVALLRSHWGSGLASEAVAALVAHGRGVLGLDKIIATVAPANLGSQRVLARAGFSRVELRRNDDGSATQLFEWRPTPAPARLRADERIVDFEPAHAETLLGLWRTSFEHGVRTIDTNPLENQLGFFRRELLPTHRVRVVVRGHGPAELVGFMASTPQSVAQLFVRVGNLGQGIGARLLALAKAESDGSLWLYAFARNVAACRFYRRHGFREVERERANMYKLEAIRFEWQRGA